MIETVNARIIASGYKREIPQVRNIKLIPSTSFEKYLVAQIPRYLLSLQKIGIQPPHAVFLSLIGVKDFWMAPNPSLDGGNKIDRDTLVIPEILIENADCKPADIRPLLDMVWNAAGHFGSPNFDTAGNWIARG
jgi:hypothetical protein